jgi:hypothetical protein
MNDVRKPPHGEAVVAVFFIHEGDGKWVPFGPPRKVLPNEPHVNSQIVTGDKVRQLAGIIYWDDKAVFKSLPMLTLPGDAFTFFFGEK